MRDATGTVMYVGKAKNLHKRLASHFAARPQSQRREQFLAAIADIEVVVVSNETEALILENNLIKHHRPRANRALTDEDEGYFYIALTAEDLPRLVPYRKNRVNKELERGGTTTAVARCFGPYVGRRFRDALLKFVSDHFRLRTCAPLPAEVCLRYHLGACGGVCEHKVSTQEYAAAVAEAAAFLSRGHADLIRHMQRQMRTYAMRLEFERARFLKTHPEALAQALEPQVVERDVPYDQDVLYFGDDRVLIMHERRGAVLGFTLCDLEPAEPAGATNTRADHFLLVRYGFSSPRHLIVNRLGSRRDLEQALTTSTGHRVHVTIPRRGQETYRLLELCALNYAYRTGQSTKTPQPAGAS